MTTSLSPRMQRASGESRVTFDLREGKTRLGDLYQRDPCRVLFPKSEPGEPPQAVMITTSGGVTVNDVVMHVAQEELPFGGVGPAGMGSYHGHDGFKEFSHKKAIYTQIKKDIGPLVQMRPPYGPGIRKYLASQLKR